MMLAGMSERNQIMGVTLEQTLHVSVALQQVLVYIIVTQ